MLPEGQGNICTEKVRDAKDHIIVTEKLDGSCVSVAKVNREIIALGRAGYPAITSPYEQHRLFHDWVLDHWEQFDALLNEGERTVGEWLAQAHGTRYDLKNRDPWVMFDIIANTGNENKHVPRLPHYEMKRRADACGFVTVPILHDGSAVGINAILRKLRDKGFYGAVTEDGAEGAVWRVEREGEVDYLAKYVRPDKVDGRFLPDTEAGKAEGVTENIWNWRPKGERKVKPWWK
jgi:ATP-dependent RNA circularization protein (DNA/RNA ligase family)